MTLKTCIAVQVYVGQWFILVNRNSSSEGPTTPEVKDMQLYKFPW